MKGGNKTKKKMKQDKKTKKKPTPSKEEKKKKDIKKFKKEAFKPGNIAPPSFNILDVVQMNEVSISDIFLKSSTESMDELINKAKEILTFRQKGLPSYIG